MNRDALREQFIDICEGMLSEEELKALRSQIEADPELQREFEAYQELVILEKEMAQEEHALHENFVVKVMDRIEREDLGFFRRIMMSLNVLTSNRLVLGGVATCALAIFCIRLADETPIPISMRQPVASSEVVDELVKNNPLSVGPIVAEPEQSAGEDRNEGLIGASRDKLDNKEERKALEMGKSVGPKLKSAKVSSTLASESTAMPFKKALQEKEQFRSREQGIVVGDAKGPEGYLHRQPSSVARIAPIPQVPAMRERYGHWTENARTFVTNNSVSTFSIDVDTGSYTNARRFLRMGQLPPADSVRIEEFINYFQYNYPVQHEQPFTLSYEIAPSPGAKGRHLLKLGIKARDTSASEKPWNLVFLVDVSGSMSSSDKLELVKKSLQVLTNNMRSGDRVAIVTYAGSAGVALQSTGIENKAQILQGIERLSSGGSTYGSGGIHEAYRIAQASRIEGGVNRIILATDGDFNVGVTNHDELIRLIEEKRKSGITLTTTGFGTGNYNEHLMEQIANKGNGNYFYIDSFKEARKVFETDLFGTIDVVAKDVKLQIEFNPQQVLEYRLVGYENRKLREEDFNNDTIDAGEIGAGHTVTALYEIVLADTPQAEQLVSKRRYDSNRRPEQKLEQATKHGAELAFLKIRHKAPGASTSQLLSFPLKKEATRKTLAEASADFRFAAAVSMFGNLLRNSQYVGSTTFADVLALADAAKGEDSLGYRQEFVELVKNAQAIRR